jgi:type I restriction enzyme M protein
VGTGETMAKRHAQILKDWQSIFLRLEELVLANSGQDAFDEIFKLLLAKLWAEKTNSQDFRVHNTPEDTANSVNRILARANGQWSGILGDLPSSLLLNEHLDICVKVLSELNFSDSSFEVLDRAFEFLISRGAKGSKGQYFTPRHVVEFCVQLLNPKKNEVLCDPACGSGGFLIHTLNHVLREANPCEAGDYCAQNLWGFEFEVRASRVANALMLLAGHGTANIYRVNSLLTPAGGYGLFTSSDSTQDGPFLTIEDVMNRATKGFVGFDVILTNPPFAGEINERHILQSYSLCRADRRVERDVLFLERCIKLLKPHGRIAIVLPHNKIGSTAWSYVREWLLKEIQVVGVIGLGRNTFLPHTHQKTGVVIGVKRPKRLREIPKEKVFFAVSERDGKDSRGQYVKTMFTNEDGPLWTTADHDLNEVLADFKKFCVNEDLAWGI